MEGHIGQQLGNYKLLRMVGQGGFANVYLGEHIHLRTQAAIKVLQVRLGENNKHNFLNEARTIAHLVHPYIVRVLDFGIQDNTPFLVMDYAPNGTFRQRFLQGKPLPAAPLVPYIKQTAAALQYGHDKKLIHRDVKPENMLLSQNDEVLLSDFGLALIAYNSNSRAPTETAGTAAYMAPEQLQGKSRPASDQYALGIIAYEWLTGLCPFQGSFFEIASQQVLTPPPPMRDRAPHTPAEVEKVVIRALEKDPQKRFPNVRDFALALEEACLASKQYSFKWQQPLVNNDGVPIASIHGNVTSQTVTGTNHAQQNKTIRKAWNEPAAHTEKPFVRPDQSTTSTNLKRPAGLGQAPAAISQPERLRPAIQPTAFANTPPTTPPVHSKDFGGSFLNMRAQPTPPASQQNLPTFPTKQQSPSQPAQYQPTQQHPYFSPNEQGPHRMMQDHSLQDSPSLFPIELSPRGQNTYTANIGQASPHTGQESHTSKTQLTLPGQSAPTNVTPAALPKAPLGARPIAPANPALMTGLQQSLPSGIHATEKATEGPDSIPGAHQTQLSWSSKLQKQSGMPLNTRDALKTTSSRDEQIAAKFAFKINRSDEETASGKPGRLLAGNILLVAVAIIVVIVGSIGIALILSNNAPQRQTNATATNVSTQSTVTSNKAAAALKATQTAQVKIANANPYVTNGTGSLILDDPLTSNRNAWQEGTDSTGITAGTCSFTDQGYKIVAPALEPTMCFQNKETYSNFTYQVDMTFTNIGQSFSGAGIVFRGNINTKEYYFFEIYGSGNYSLQKCTTTAGCTNSMDGYKLGKPALTTFKQGINVTNTLAVVADGGTFTLFINKEKISTVTDQISAPYSSGNIGVMATGGNDTGADSTTNTPTDVIFSHAKVWK
ncbi:serine/threonine-protein kinase [Dictyobacter formicarum]|uniref:non-specific serine/threonine protein kinase n=1 Tax=Dictyobacter formicarum TaxID=2778368 RepID=A0ABQ3VGX8_9CHLR|nr:serine/threonine-protein kinase [Dictyobacter formicarum]GHO85439.1 hypothetical protein KSZ_34450 [Dictyobacter formicarum]